MGEKRQKPDWYCQYCKKGKGVLGELRELGYTQQTIKCETIQCPKCDTWQEVNK